MAQTAALVFQKEIDKNLWEQHLTDVDATEVDKQLKTCIWCDMSALRLLNESKRNNVKMNDTIDL